MFEAGAKGLEVLCFEVVEGAFGDKKGDLPVVVAIDEDGGCAVVEVAESVFGIAGAA